MSIKIDAKSRKALVKVKKLKSLTLAGIQHASYVSGKGLIKATSDEILRKPKGGRVYVSRDRAGRRRRHVASAPGETHANLTGKLRKSLSFSVSGKNLEFGYGVQKNNMPEYGQYVEFGTGKMKPRPSLQNGVKSQERNIEKNLIREIGKRTGARLTVTK